MKYDSVVNSIHDIFHNIKVFAKYIWGYKIKISIITPPPTTYNTHHNTKHSQLANLNHSRESSLDSTQNSVESKKLLAEFALNIWRIDTKTRGANLQSSRAITSSIKRIYELLESHQIIIKDYTNTKYNDGLNIDIVECVRAEATDSTDIHEMILETLSPSIIINGEIYKKAKVIKETKILKE